MADSVLPSRGRPTTEYYEPLGKYQAFPKNAVPVVPAPQHQYFKLFPYLSEELKGTVLSYVADAPLETEYSTKSSLTHTLPAVNRQFRALCNGNPFWKDAVVRMLKNEPELWKTALHNLVRDDAEEEGRPSSLGSRNNSNKESATELVERTHKFLQEHQGHNISSYKSIYQAVVNHYLRFQGPVFCMPGHVALGQPYALHLFEYRYRVLIAQVLRGQGAAARNGGSLTGPPVYFLHANRGLEATAPAVLVQVTECRVFADGRADVVLLPVNHVWIERVWMRADQGNLYYAQALKMGRAVTQQMNQLHRQEALANVMDRLAGELLAHSNRSSSSSGSDELSDDSFASYNSTSESDS